MLLTFPAPLECTVGRVYVLLGDVEKQSTARGSIFNDEYLTDLDPISAVIFPAAKYPLIPFNKWSLSLVVDAFTM